MDARNDTGWRLATADTTEAKVDGRRKARKITCRMCGEKCTVHSHKALFCSAKCAKAFNVRRDNRARVMYDLVMAGRYDRNRNKLWLTKLSQLAYGYRQEDLTKGGGRKSWYDSTHRDL